MCVCVCVLVVTVCFSLCRLFIANVGDSRAVLCYLDKNGELQAEQISDVHNVYNPNEQQRLARLGMSVEHLVRFGRLGPYQVTLSDHTIKGGYVDILRYSVVLQSYVLLRVFKS